MIRRPPRSTLSSSSAASDVYKRQGTTRRSLWKTASVTSIGTALVSRTSTTARRWDTTHNGSYVVLRTNASTTDSLPPPTRTALRGRATSRLRASVACRGRFCQRGSSGAGSSPAGPPVGCETMDYPDAPRLDVVDELFGSRVADPYRWLEDASLIHISEPTRPY